MSDGNDNITTYNNLTETEFFSPHAVALDKAKREAKNENVVCWYLKFNKKLDPASVSKDTMGIMETNGYKLDAIIGYDSWKHLISIRPIDPYDSDDYYILAVSKDVCSEDGEKLKNEIFMLFKLQDNEVQDFRYLTNYDAIPTPRIKPIHEKYKTLLKSQEKLNAKRADEARIFALKESEIDNYKLEALPYSGLNVNVSIGIIGLILAVLGTFNYVFFFFGGIVSMMRIAHIIAQMRENVNRSIVQYNIGAYLFNRKKYEKSRHRFIKALLYDPKNKNAKFASGKVNLFSKYR